MKYTGGCHCGKVRFEVEATIEKLLDCNCSICSKRGHLLAFAPDANFKLASGEDSLTDYQWGKKSIHFTFCKVCGVAPFGSGAMPDGAKMRSINARCLDNFEIEGVEIQHYDGKHI